MLITDRTRTSQLPLLEAVRRAVDAGIDAVQLREKDLSAGELYRLALELRAITAGRCLLIVNDRLDVALSVEADGLHLPETGLPIDAVRRLTSPNLLVGRSTHSVTSARRAQAEGADYVELGTIFATRSKPGVRPAGAALIKDAARVLSIPFLAVGGIDSSNSREIISAGAAGIAVIGAVLDAPNVCDAVLTLRRAMEGAA